jgi:hypothetical protein
MRGRRLSLMRSVCSRSGWVEPDAQAAAGGRRPHHVRAAGTRFRVRAFGGRLLPGGRLSLGLKQSPTSSPANGTHASRVPACEAVIQFQLRALAPVDPKSGRKGGCFSRPVVELAIRVSTEAILTWPFCNRRFAGGNWITASCAGMTNGTKAIAESTTRRTSPSIPCNRPDRDGSGQEPAIHAAGIGIAGPPRGGPVHALRPAAPGSARRNSAGGPAQAA